MRSLALALALIATPTLAADPEPPATPLDPLAWKTRPVVLFAPADDHPRLVEARRAIDAARAGFDERDMHLIVVTGDAHAALRKRFGVPRDTFAALLIGKDGGEKERADRLESLTAWFTRIDSMPMRIREMREARPTPRTP